MALDKKLRAKLDKASKAWGKAKERAATEKSQFDEVEDGRYIARLVGAEIGESKSSGRLQAIWEYKIAEGDYKGQTKRDFDGLETEDNLVFLARKIRRFGYDAPDDLEDVEALLTQIAKEKPLVRIRLKTRGEFQNVYIDAVFDKTDEDEVLADAAAEGSDEEETEEVETEEAETEEEAEEESAEEEAEEEAEDEEEAEEEAEDEEVELATGMVVLVPHNGKKERGTVIEILDKENKVRVKLDSGKVVRAGIDTLEAPDADEEEEIPEAPAKAPKGKAKPAPAKRGKK